MQKPPALRFSHSAGRNRKGKPCLGCSFQFWKKVKSPLTTHTAMCSSWKHRTCFIFLCSPSACDFLSNYICSFFIQTGPFSRRASPCAHVLHGFWDPGPVYFGFECWLGARQICSSSSHWNFIGLTFSSPSDVCLDQTQEINAERGLHKQMTRFQPWNHIEHF